jgi:hypothetical protein
MVESFEEDEIEDIDDEINMMEGDPSSEVYVTHNYYEKYLIFN